MKKLLDAYLIVGAMEHFGLLSVHGKPTQNTYTALESDNDMKKDYVQKTIQEFIYSHVITAVPEAKEKESSTVTLQCHICGKKYVRKRALKNHKEKVHQETSAELETNIDKEDEDHVYNYTRLLLILLLLLHNHDNAILQVMGLVSYGCINFFICISRSHIAQNMLMEPLSYWHKSTIYLAQGWLIA